MSNIIEPALLCDFLRNLDLSTILIEPKPNRDLLDKMFQACLPVDWDQESTRFRFVVIENEVREIFGAALVEAGRDLDEESAYRMKSLAFEAPQQIILIVRIMDATLGLKAETLVDLQKAFSFVHSLRLLARGYHYSTKWIAFNGESDGAMRELLQLDSGESMVGWLNIGSDALNQDRFCSFKRQSQRLTFLDH